MPANLPEPRIEKGRIWCELIKDWRKDQPEERVRQSFILHLNQHYGYAFNQMKQEQRTFSGTRSPRVDIVVWESAEDAARDPAPTPALVVECKSEEVDIHPRDFYQGESYARSVGCEFLVMHNKRQTSFFRVQRTLPGQLVALNELPKAADWGDAKRLAEIRESQRAFGRQEFQRLLLECHTILRDVHKTDPGKAFDSISKILFTKMYVERTGTHGTFTKDFLDERSRLRLPGDKPVHELLFDQTKVHYQADDLFGAGETLDVSESTFRRIVGKLERFNLSATGDDIKGLAFEQFLGKTFRGELGQYFTPRPVVEFMVQLLDPQEEELVCDPAAGSGGFLIKAFEHIRSQIEANINRRKDNEQERIEALGLPEDKTVALVDAAFAKLNLELMVTPPAGKPSTRLSRLSRDCIFGTDAEARAARTAKMNMIMHGDGHGGIHYHDGLIDINGIFAGRFDVVLSNPPFGSTVGDDQRVGDTEQGRVPTDEPYMTRSLARYGTPWQEAHERLVVAARDHTKILDLYETGKGKPARPSELVFVERAIELLKPGGRLGIVLPDGNLNNPSLGWLRRWAEGRARLMAVVSLPAETFSAAKASVKASLMFLRRFTEADAAEWDLVWEEAHAALDPDFAARRDALCEEHADAVTGADLKALEGLLLELERRGAGRTAPTWRALDPPPYPRGQPRSAVTAPAWTKPPKGMTKVVKAEVTELRADVAVTIAGDPTVSKALADASRRLGRELRRLDRAHSVALWEQVRTAFDYPVFAAAPATVGITATGLTSGTNDLTGILTDYRTFATWVAAGADSTTEPAFAE